MVISLEIPWAGQHCDVRSPPVQKLRSQQAELSDESGSLALRLAGQCQLVLLQLQSLAPGSQMESKKAKNKVFILAKWGPENEGRNEHLLLPVLAQISELNNPFKKLYKKTKGQYSNHLIILANCTSQILNFLIFISHNCCELFIIVASSSWFLLNSNYPSRKSWFVILVPAHTNPLLQNPLSHNGNKSSPKCASLITQQNCLFLSCLHWTEMVEIHLHTHMAVAAKGKRRHNLSTHLQLLTLPNTTEAKRSINWSLCS